MFARKRPTLVETKSAQDDSLDDHKPPGGTTDASEGTTLKSCEVQNSSDRPTEPALAAGDPQKTADARTVASDAKQFELIRNSHKAPGEIMVKSEYSVDQYSKLAHTRNTTHDGIP